MPVYEYRCRTCSHQFEIQQSFSDEALTECPQCTGELRKVFAPVGITFKGSGFYKNDSRSGGSGAPKSTESTSTTSTTSTESTSGAGSSGGSDPAATTSAASSD